MLEALVTTLTVPLLAVNDLIAGGGPVVLWIFVTGVVLWTLALERYWYFKWVLPREADRMIAAWGARREHKSWCARSIRLAMISRLNAGMTSKLTLMRTLVPLAPLLGLIGTVSGMLEVFEAMALRGSADARTMAEGVSHAMICTMSGLAVSISGLYPVHYFSSRARRKTELYFDEFEF
jgi:biopolymer transport protein ExbB